MFFFIHIENPAILLTSSVKRALKVQLHSIRLSLISKCEEQLMPAEEYMRNSLGQEHRRARGPACSLEHIRNWSRPVHN